MAFFESPDLITIRRFAGYSLTPVTGDALSAALEASLAALNDDTGPYIKRAFLDILKARETALNAANKFVGLSVDDDYERDVEEMAKRRFEIAQLANEMCSALGVVPGPALRSSLRGAQGRNGKLVL